MRKQNIITKNLSKVGYEINKYFNINLYAKFMTILFVRDIAVLGRLFCYKI